MLCPPGSPGPPRWAAAWLSRKGSLRHRKPRAQATVRNGLLGAANGAHSQARGFPWAELLSRPTVSAPGSRTRGATPATYRGLGAESETPAPGCPPRGLTAFWEGQARTVRDGPPVCGVWGQRYGDGQTHWTKTHVGAFRSWRALRPRRAPRRPRPAPARAPRPLPLLSPGLR